MARILLIDDDVDLVEMNRLVLLHRGHSVASAYSASDARQVLQQATFDLAVLDVMMESATAGLELASEMRRDYPNLPIVMLSGIHTSTGSPVRLNTEDPLPVSKFMDKPVAPSALADEIEAILSKVKTQ